MCTCSTSPPSGNLVDGLPLVAHWGEWPKSNEEFLNGILMNRRAPAASLKKSVIMAAGKIAGIAKQDYL